MPLSSGPTKMITDMEVALPWGEDQTLRIEDMSRVNLFTGRNCSGKSTVLRLMAEALGNNTLSRLRLGVFSVAPCVATDEAVRVVRNLFDPTLTGVACPGCDPLGIGERLDGSPLNFSDGMQDVFSLIQFMCAVSVRWGYIFMDLSALAIHPDVMAKLAYEIISLSRSLDVQLFLLTYSKEFIDAFVAMDTEPSSVSYIAIVRPENNITEAVCFKGDAYKRLVEAGGVDIRRAKCPWPI